ncbi:hypothetical protein RvY_13842-2 [Ramazzottius varieornatus]|uniref:Uncharacterized protein n=1 Tax=Ramazzottius varieornatus TaxID=947166 RepID=A0A1D1VRE7_RAMVA|nr:hypothetical protein RvY_13842-2 [Ramazzottius varieornatus]
MVYHLRVLAYRTPTDARFSSTTVSARQLQCNIAPTIFVIDGFSISVKSSCLASQYYCTRVCDVIHLLHVMVRTFGVYTDKGWNVVFIETEIHLVQYRRTSFWRSSSVASAQYVWTIGWGHLSIGSRQCLQGEWMC